MSISFIAGNILLSKGLHKKSVPTEKLLNEMNKGYVAKKLQNDSFMKTKVIPGTKPF
jgi:hypothetical protein